MSDAPERLWVGKRGYWGFPNEGATEYVRADLHQAALDRAEADAAARVDAMREACMTAIPNGWMGEPHQSNMDYGPNVSAKAKAAIRAIPAPAPMTVQAAAKVPEVAELIKAARAYAFENDCYDEENITAMNAWRSARDKMDAALKPFPEAKP
jgi:hypothetical protein